MAKKQDVIAKVQEILGVDEEGNAVKVSKKEATKNTEAVIQAISDLLVADGKVSLYGFGDFAVRTRKGRLGRNPQTGEQMQIPETKNVGFKAKQALKDRIK